jgi:hypothetical protein
VANLLGTLLVEPDCSFLILGILFFEEGVFLKEDIIVSLEALYLL